jgi:hypothetical protein
MNLMDIMSGFSLGIGVGMSVLILVKHFFER